MTLDVAWPDSLRGPVGKAVRAENKKEGGGRMLSFARDIRLLFRDSDVEAMRYVFDLGRYEDVKANAEGIYERVADGSMPCDEAWPADQIARLRQWVDEGSPP